MRRVILVEGNLPADRSFAPHLGGESPSWARHYDVAYPEVVRRSGGALVLPIPHVRAFAQLAGDDLRDALDLRGDASVAFARLASVDGVIFYVDCSRLRTSLRAMRNLLASIAAAGRDPDSVPMVFAVGRAETYADDDFSLELASTLFERAKDQFVVADPETGEGALESVARVLELLRRDGSVSPASSRIMPSWCTETLEHEAVRFDWGGGSLLTEARLLDAWRACRSPDLANLLDAVSYADRNMRPNRVCHDWWVNTCRRRDPRDLPVLLDTLLLWEKEESLSGSLPRWTDGTPLQEHVTQVVERIDGLCWWQEDPRITARIGSILDDLTRYRRLTVWQALFRLLIRHGDPRTGILAARLARGLHAIRAPLIHRDHAIAVGTTSLWDHLRWRFPGQIPGSLFIEVQHRDAWNALVERIRRPLPRPEDMQSIADDPHNDDLRRELALRMQERGDPRGEFILLQLAKAAGSLSPEEHEREQALKRTYAWDWLGPLADVVDVENSVFEKGYPVKVTVWTPNTRAIRDVIGKPEWATIREMRWGGDPCWEEEAPDPALVNHPVMKSLQSVTTKMPEDPVELEALKRVAWAR